MIPIDKLIRLL